MQRAPTCATPTGCIRYLREQDVLFNLAGQTSHLDSMTDPRTDLEINCTAQLSLLEACRQDNPGLRIVFAGTRQIYGKPRYLPVDEAHPIDPVDVNGINKMAGEWYHLLYGRVYGLRVTRAAADQHVRPAHARAGRPADLPRDLDQAGARRRGAARLRRRQPAARLRLRRRRRRALLPRGHVATDAIGEVFNLGGPARTSASRSSPSSLVATRRRRAATGSCRSPRTARRSTSATTTRTIRKLRDELGWGPDVGLEEGLAATLDYYRRHGERYWGGRMSVPFLDLARAARGAARRPGRRRRARARQRAGTSSARVEAFEQAFAPSAAPRTRSASPRAPTRSRSRCGR